jgi:hypothetical protein
MMDRRTTAPIWPTVPASATTPITRPTSASSTTSSALMSARGAVSNSGRLSAPRADPGPPDAAGRPYPGATIAIKRKHHVAAWTDDSVSSLPAICSRSRLVLLGAFFAAAFLAVQTPAIADFADDSDRPDFKGSPCGSACGSGASAKEWLIGLGVLLLIGVVVFLGAATRTPRD